ncbi:ankyrin repeat domain-containing protein 45 [Protopterus annectens]|uniref:ankyrin repeat domain-containing protein 45 n=1 Tax=Protopterus annectens TaxID=7888 RepID=UPI001CFA8B79|nr:ankyrin repeat domain-containing protein 45 [Protopterus annectens]XP_043941170.1 ankyrin repeat domain-containing protein 45 [Protopterus annectens]
MATSESNFSNPVLACALLGDVQGLQKHFENPDDPSHEEASNMLLQQDAVGRTPFSLACITGHSEIVRQLAKYGANLEEKTIRGYTPLHYAATWGQLDTVRALVELGADIQAYNFLGERPRDIAIRYSKTSCVDYLDWAEAKQALQLYITHIQGIISDPEKVQGRLTKEDKNTSSISCNLKSDWLLNTKNPTIQEMHEQRQQLEDMLQPILNKLTVPVPEMTKSGKS